MNKNGNAVVQLLVLLVVAALTSGVILFLVQSGLISVKAQSEVPILNTEFVPFEREGYLTLREFNFCAGVDEQLHCNSPQDSFALGSEVHFRFAVESSTYNGEIMIVENYKILGPQGELLLDVDAKNNFEFNAQSDKAREVVTFKDYFVLRPDLPEGTYTLELNLENPLINKKVRSTQQFMMVRG